MVMNNGHNPDHGNAELVMLKDGEIIGVYSSWKYAYADMASLEAYEPTGQYQIKRACFL